MYTLYVSTVHNSVNHLYYEEVLEQQPVLYVNNNDNVNMYNYVNNKQLIHGLLSIAIAVHVYMLYVGTIHNSVNHLYCEEEVEQQPVLYVNKNHINVNMTRNY